jgi:hypothetical protein
VIALDFDSLRNAPLLLNNSSICSLCSSSPPVAKSSYIPQPLWPHDFRVNVIPAPLRLSSINTVVTLAKLADRLPNNQVDTGTEVTPVQHLMVMRVAVQLERDIKVHRPTKSALSGS